MWVEIDKTHKLIGLNLPSRVVRPVRVLMVKVPHPDVFQKVVVVLVISPGLRFPVEGVQ